MLAKRVFEHPNHPLDTLLRPGISGTVTDFFARSHIPDSVIIVPEVEERRAVVSSLRSLFSRFPSLVLRPHPPEGEGLVAFERFLGLLHIIRKAILNQLEVFEVLEIVLLLAKLSQKTSHKPKKREETLRIP